MKQKKVIIVTIIALLGLFSLFMLSSCDSISLGTTGHVDGSTSGNSSGTNGGSSNSQQPSQTEGTSNNPTVAQPTVNVPDILVPTAPGIDIEENGQAIVDFSNKQDGYIMAKYLEETDMTVKILISVPDGEEPYQYTLRPNREFEVFPLSGGNGVYEIGVYKQVEGTRYSLLLSLTIDVTLVDEFAPFLRPNQVVNFNQNSNAVRKAAELVAGKSSFMDIVGAIYHFVIENIVYDVHLAETVQIGYIPDVDMVLASGKGICYDYAALMTAMLRSQGIPTRLVVGYTGDVYHAWISVYSKEDGWLDDVIFFDGSAWRLLDPTFAAGGSAAAVAQYIGDGTNYVVRFLH